MFKQFKQFMNNVHLLVAVALFAGTVSTSALAVEPVRPAAAVVSGDLAGVGQATEFVLHSAVVAGDTLYLALEDAAGAAAVVLRVPRGALREASLALGQTVTLAADGFGWLLQSAGRVIAVIPPESAGLLR